MSRLSNFQQKKKNFFGLIFNICLCIKIYFTSFTIVKCIHISSVECFICYPSYFSQVTTVISRVFCRLHHQLMSLHLPNCWRPLHPREDQGKYRISHLLLFRKKSGTLMIQMHPTSLVSRTYIPYTSMISIEAWTVHMHIHYFFL